MGAEHSSISVNEAVPFSYRDLDADGVASVPSSPNRSRGNGPVHDTLPQTSRSLSLSVPRESLGTNRQSDQRKKQSTVIMSRDRSTSQRSGQMHRSSSACTGASGVVVVCPGPLQRHRKAGSFDSVSGRVKPETIEASVRKLEQIPSFTPFLPSSTTVIRSNTKTIHPIVARLDSSKLFDLVDTYRHHVCRSTDSACKVQQRAIGLQNKVDYELKRILEELKAREKGNNSKTPSTGTACHSELLLAGQKQIDELVLQSTQISGLIDQSSEVITSLCESLQRLNQCLPMSERLPPLPSDLHTSAVIPQDR